MKIKHSDIEELRANPRSFLKRPPQNSPPFGPHSVLRFSMLQIHKEGDNIDEARAYLRRMFAGRGGRFTDASLTTQLGRLEAYYASYLDCPGRACDVQHRLSGVTPAGNIVVGEVARIDTGIDYGPGLPYYYAWVFASREAAREAELRMPVLQFAVAQDLKCPVEEVGVGVYCHETSDHAWKVYSLAEVTAAVDQLDTLIRMAEA